MRKRWVTLPHHLQTAVAHTSFLCLIASSMLCNPECRGFASCKRSFRKLAQARHASLGKTVLTWRREDYANLTRRKIELLEHLLDFAWCKLVSLRVRAHLVN